MKNRISGFTLVELMVVVLVVGLVVLLFTQIPLFSFSSWTKGSERLKLQRDAHYAMLRIQRKLRPASLTEDPVVSVPDDSTLVIGEDSFYVDKEGASETNDFFYDLVQESGGNKQLIVKGDKDTEFIIERNGDTINITLTLVKENVGTIILTTAVKPRN